MKALTSAEHSSVELTTRRLCLRQWIADDLSVFAAINADPEVMAYFPATLSASESAAVMKRMQANILRNGWGFWALQLRASGEVIGFAGLNQPDQRLPCSPCTEIGWRLARRHWGKGYATEAAQRALAFAFDELALDEILSFTTVGNRRSQAVMKRLGMENTGMDFEHPLVSQDSGLRRHVLYCITRQMYDQLSKADHWPNTAQRCI